ncbi:hypothetical protein BN85400860 [Alteracholeplasma palmae J233]|uniref:Uncharacterized protein n=1 Tax=Alteracholeplasma palmae (strain ATCC 49389 / J233) TaxID=1318466 RepID=U4KJR5_ALTPJ|nr:hypothetical protein [Alteracholeplasma palmae]CCV63663.1 hypothetical protein BN85400860 [Alteracholeplasma palmae J233]
MNSRDGLIKSVKLVNKLRIILLFIATIGYAYQLFYNSAYQGVVIFSKLSAFAYLVTLVASFVSFIIAFYPSHIREGKMIRFFMFMISLFPVILCIASYFAIIYDLTVVFFSLWIIVIILDLFRIKKILDLVSKDEKLIIPILMKDAKIPDKDQYRNFKKDIPNLKHSELILLLAIGVSRIEYFIYPSILVYAIIQVNLILHSCKRQKIKKLYVLLVILIASALSGLSLIMQLEFISIENTTYKDTSLFIFLIGLPVYIIKHYMRRKIVFFEINEIINESIV